MADHRAAVIISATAKAAAAAVAAVGSAAKGSASGLRSMASIGGKALETLDRATAVTERGVKFLERSYRMASQVIGETIAESLKFREAGDPTVKFFKDLSREGEQVKAKIGDILIPIVMGFTKAAGEATGSVSKWLQANRKLIASGIVEWIGKVGNMMISVVARSTMLVTKAWYGWAAIIDIVKMLGNDAFAAMIGGAAKVIESMSKAARFIGAEGIAGSLEAASQAMRDFQTVVHESSAEASASLEKTAADMASMEAHLSDIEVMSRRALNAGVVVAMEAVKNSTASTTTSVEELNAALARTERLQAAGVRGMKAAAKEAQAMWEADADAAEKHGKEIDAQQKASMEAAAATAKSYADAAVGAAMAIGDAWAKALLEHQKAHQVFESVGKAMIAQVIQIATQMIMAWAAVAAAAQFKTWAGVGPGIGIILGAAAAGTTLGLVRGLISEMASGGEVQGGQPGRDSVLALLQPKERVLNVEEAGLLTRLMRSVSQPRAGGRNSSGVPAFARGGEVRAMTSSSSSPGAMVGGGITLNASMSLLDAPSSSTQRRQLAIRMAREWEGLIRDGVIMRGMQRPRTV